MQPICLSEGLLMVQNTLLELTPKELQIFRHFPLKIETQSVL